MGAVRFAKMVLRLYGLPATLQVGIYVFAGLAVGLAVFVARISNAASYLSDAPQACINCHVMTDAYVSWERGSHARGGACNDCHVPHSNIIAKWAFKAFDGLKHSYVFTLRKEPQVIELSRTARPIVQDNCAGCHVEAFAAVRLGGSEERKCWDCHTDTHGGVQGLSASPAELRPQLRRAGRNGTCKGVPL